MKFQLVSDIHVEAYHDPSHVWKLFTPQAETLVLAGDIDARKFEPTLSEIATKFERVIYVLGNHEFYHKDISWLPDQSKLPDNVHLLNPGVFELDDVVFIGATLWTDFGNEDWFIIHSAKDMINDFNLTRNGDNRFTPRNAVERFRKEKQFIKMMIEKYKDTDKKIVVVTHFMPSYSLVHEKWKTHTSDSLNRYFSANCDDLIAYLEKGVWCFGHTHDFRDIMLGDVRCVANPYGYPRENNGYNDLVIEV